MLGWSGTSKDKKFSLQIDSSHLLKMGQFCEQADSKETGGILVGYYSADLSLATVSDVTGPPRDSQSWWFSFRRGVQGLKDLLHNKWYSKIRTHYIGEWHYHPSVEVNPSQEDFLQMVKISQNPAYRCSEPIMIILGKPDSSGNRSLRCFVTVNSSTMELF
ncbi:MAG: Mov34/MPN/PAD-1 family protein [Candidatus Cloacimonetes bacterium]|nr:Mov34/MPN/PAD-1 family protein [Candidatus Cloacimonadota bacterium]